jgi:hypothetical protein
MAGVMPDPLVELRYPPATHVWCGRTVKRIDRLTLDEARVTILRLCDDLQEAREALCAELEARLAK